jgi:hypothetical protein
MKGRTTLILVLCAACSPGETDLTADGSSVGSVVDGDSGASGSDSAADTGEAPIEGSEFNGDYQGWYEMVVTLSGYSDTCEGQAEITMDVESEPQINGESSCDFHGMAAEYLGLRDTYIGGLSGILTDSPAAEGSALSEMGDMGKVSVPWEGSFDEDTLTGGFVGTTTLTIEGYDLEIEFTGAFSVMR